MQDYERVFQLFLDFTERALEEKNYQQMDLFYWQVLRMAMKARSQ